MTLKDQLQHKIDNKTKPLGSLGLLEELALKIGLVQNTLSPKIEKQAHLVFAADHGLADEGISPYPKDVTWQMVMNFCAGGASINVFCRQNEMELKVYDVGVDYNFTDELPVINAKVANGSRNMRKEPAMTSEECNAAMEVGAIAVREQVAIGCNTIGCGEMGIGNTSPSSLLMHKFTGLSIEDCTGRGSGLGDQQVDRKTKILKEIAEKYTPATPEEILATFGGLEIAAMTGAYLEAKKQNMLILIDGFIATAAVLTAIQIEPSVKDNCIFCHSSDEKGHKLMLEHLGVKPLLQLGMRLGEGTGVAVAMPLIHSAVNFLNEMSSMEDAGVSNKD
ncbi:nicotinate-nucleotide--dimethylbenzimidazole phosphoribosyltransferase [Draconibacterium sp. IB214405]|uniref:nicotinate-nucleotide--dimethylbenzimidazole phosphoribosyltransferase n=1 Tax=Draconibacterium sp. IB214405 TaxID=3097352 RepID=UPI002A1235AD|nr:nicotinate-nucleotide--dimethylbenzimidazole phosphoribosyltransferase [Draconibacterium sp. IB214405]MDX8341078.1 nicotinate-nucleotide--dimethylbenzimidazole phosphoribosyltransferase [Draconibacterium sp. IB214405]